MAKKTTSTAAKKKEQERLNQGGQNIANIAQNIVARRQEQAVNKIGQQYGIRRTAGDMMATRALSAIQDREMLSYRKRLEEEERRRREAEAARQQNVAGNLRSAAQRVNIGGMAGNPTQERLRKSSLEAIMDGLKAKIGNEQKIINEQGRAEDDPARLRAEQELADLEKRQKDTQEKITAIPQVGTNIARSPEENNYIRKLMEISGTAGKRLQEKGITRLPGGQKVTGEIPRVVSKDYASFQHMINTPDKAEGQEYIDWLKEGRDVGLYGDRELNAMLGNVTNKTAADEYRQMDDSQKSSWFNLKDQESQHWDNAMQWIAEHPEGTDAETLRALRQQYQDELTRAQEELSAVDNPDFRERSNRLKMLGGDMPLPNEWEAIRDENGAIIGTTEPEPEFLDMIRSGKKPDDYDAREGEWDRWMYDFIYGTGAWDREFRDGDEAESDRALERLEELWDRFENGTIGEMAQDPGLLEKQSRVDYYTDKLGETDNKLEYYQRVNDYKDRYRAYMGENSAEDDAKYDQGKYNPNDYRYTLAEKGSNNIDDIYSFIIGGKERQAYITATADGWGEKPPNISKDYRGAMLLQPDEINIFKNLYEAGKKDEAAAFLDGLQFAINQRYIPFEEVQTREEARAFPILNSIIVQGANVLAGLQAPVTAVAGNLGADFAQDPNSDWYATTRYAQNTQDEIANMLGPEAGKVYLQSMNSIRNVINGVLMYKMGIPAGLLPTATLTTFGTQIYQEQMYNHLQETYDFGKAQALAVLDTALEIGEELLPIETMFATGGMNVFLRVISNMLAEGGEELAGATAGEVLRGIITGRNSWEKRRDQIFNEGGYTDDSGNWVDIGTGKQGLAEADKQAMREWGKQIVENTAGGFFGGGFGAVYGTVTNSRQMSKAGQAIQSRQNVVGTQTGADQLIAAAQGMAAGTESRKIADKIAEKVAKGGRASNYQLGKLTFTMSQESNETVAGIAQGTIERMAREQLAADGMDQKTIDRVAPVVAKAAARGTDQLTISDRMNLATSRKAIDLLKTYVSDDGSLAEVKAAMTEENGGQAAMNVRQTVNELMTGRKSNLSAGFATNEIRDAQRTAVVASEDDISDAEGTLSGTGLDVIVDNRIGVVTGRNGDQYTVRYADGTEQNVTSSTLVAANPGLATLMEYGERENSHINDEAFNAILQGISENAEMDGGQYVNDAVNAYMKYRMLGEVQNNQLNEATLQKIRQAAEAANQAAREAANAKGMKQAAVTPGQGVLKFDGVQYGTQEWRRKVKTLGGARAEQASALGQLVTMMGSRVQLINDESNPGLFGWEDSTGEIVINLAAKDASGTTYARSRNLMTIAAHELTHWIEQNSREGYEQLRQFVFDQLRAQGGENAVEALVMQTMEDYRRAAENNSKVKAVDLEGAMAEVVANACDNILSNKKIAAALQAENPDLYKTVRGFVQNFVARMQSATRDMSDTRESRLMKQASQEVQDQLADLWLKGYKEGTQMERTTEQAEASQAEEDEEAPAQETDEPTEPGQLTPEESVHPESSQFSVTQMAEAANLAVIEGDESLTLYMESPNGKTVKGLDKNKKWLQVDGVKVKITPDMIRSTPVGMLIDMGLSDEIVNKAGMTQKESARKMFADLMNLCARYRDNNLIWEIAGSEFAATFSALKNNSDPQYRNTVDFGTICSKTQAIVDVLSDTMKQRIADTQRWNERHPNDQRVFKGLDRQDIMTVYNETHNAKLSVPCPVCYVFSRWMGVPSLLGQMNRFQHDYVVTEKDENGQTVYDKNGDAVIDWEKTAEVANRYIKGALEKYGSKKAITDAKTKLQNKIGKREDNLPDLQKVVAELTRASQMPGLTQKQKDGYADKIAKAKAAVQRNIRETDEFTKQLEEVEAYNWVTQALCVQHTEGKKTVNDLDENGNYIVDKTFRLTPEEILFDLNRTGEFAGYTKNWRYRTTRGAGMGKAIMPYSGAAIGDLVHGDSARWASSQNPFLLMNEKDARKAFENAKERVRKQNLVGGQRFQSTSDFRPEWGLDYMMSFLEMQALGSKVQMYTKVREAVDFLGSIGADVNQSIMASGNGWHIATEEEIEQAKTDADLRSRMGVTRDKEGVKHTYVMDFSDVTGMNYDTAKANSKKYNSVQMILVGMNDVHIRLALANDDIDFVIPWHSSGNSKDVLQQLVRSVDETLTESDDYTKFQEEKKKKNRSAKQAALWDARVKLLQEGAKKLTQAEIDTLQSNPITAELYRRFAIEGVDDDCYGVTLPKDQAEKIFPYEYWDKTSTRKNADVNGKRFVEYCEAMGLTPRFAMFKNEKGYWKLLIDRKMYENNVLNPDGSVKTWGKYREQQVVDVTAAEIGQLPTEATAKYGTRYEAETIRARENSIAALRKKYDAEPSDNPYTEHVAKEKAPAEAPTRQMSISQDSEGRGLSKEQREYFKNSKAVDDEGNLLVLYHGTGEASFTVFEVSNSVGYFFTDDKQTAKTYTEGEAGWDNGESTLAPTKDETMADLYYNGYIGPGTYEVYLNLTNPLEIDGNGSFWSSVVDSQGKALKGISNLSKDEIRQIADNMSLTPEQLEQQYAWNEDIEVEAFDTDEMIARPWKKTRDWVQYAKDNGYDGVIFRNIYDTANEDVWWPSDIFVALDPEQIKSVNNTEPTTDPDIRFSVDQGDMDVHEWMKGLTKDSVSTIQEKNMLEQYQTLAKEIETARSQLQKREAKLDELINKEDITVKDRRMIEEESAAIEQKRDMLNDKLRKMARMTTGKGFAKLMYDQSRIMNDLVNGRTVEEVRQTIDDIGGELDLVKQQMAERDKEIAALKERAIDAVRSLDNVPGAEEAASQLKQIVNQMVVNERSLRRSKARINEVAENAKVAGTRTGNVQRAVKAAIAYNNKLTEQSEAVMWEKKRRLLLNTLRSEAAQALINQRQEFEEKLTRDKTIRDMQAENLALRKRINTNIVRVKALLTKETTSKNIPEHMKPIARELLRLVVTNDLSGRKLTGLDNKQLAEAARLLKAWEAQDEKYNPYNLKGMDEGLQDVIFNAMNDIMSGIDFYNRDERGNRTMDKLENAHGALTEISDAVATVVNIINAEREISLGDRRMLLEDMAFMVQNSTGGKRARQMTGKAGMAITELRKAVISGNITPEYFFRALKNAGMTELWEEYHRAENKNGLLLKRAKDRLAEIAKEYKYDTWDMEKRYTVKLASGDVQMTMGQIMALYATWRREHTLGPAMSNHLKVGGFYVEEYDPRKGFLGVRQNDMRAHRVNEMDIGTIQSMMTDEQKKFVADVVDYMSNEMSKIGNEASMRAYGIKMYKEKFYYPFKMWDGIKSRNSNDAGKAAGMVDQVFRPSFSKNRTHGANNALVIGDFMQTATDHIIGMINYATIGPANENIQKVLNYQALEGNDPEAFTKRSIRAVLQEAYGREAIDYITNLQMHLNGGVGRVERTLYDRLLTVFRKNSVAASLSVALQQPLSYIRASVMINPKYLAEGVIKEYWKDSYKERMEHSGVSVIKEMGKFDMGFGQSAREYITPEGKTSTARKVWDKTVEYSTILPEMMDRWTWNRLWVAVKAEQHDMHPEMDMKSNEFLGIVAERFNEVVRRTQVYDSALVKSQNMRSQNPFMKSVTSFMAEPTLTLNVLADAVRNVNQKGGKQVLVIALAQYALGAAAQAAAKALMGSGRTPDEKKTWEENFLYKFYSNLISEIDVLNLVPGYNDIITLLKDGKLEDDALGVLSKLYTAWDKTMNLQPGEYRSWEDGPAQIIQLFGRFPAKNIMRDLRAMYNWFIGKPYADRASSKAVLKYQAWDAVMSADNLFGVVVAKLGESGYKTTNAAYYGRMFDAMQAGDTAEAEAIREYLHAGKGVKGETINEGLRKQAKERLAEGDATQWLVDHDMLTDTGTITKQYREGKITAEQAKSMYKEVDSRLSDNDIWFKIDQVDWMKETGATSAGSDYYYRLGPALETNRSTEINKVIKGILDHGKTEKEVKTRLTTELKDKYLNADSAGKVKVRNQLQIAYKAIGYTAADADKIIDGWVKDAKKKEESKEPKKPENKDTTGQWGKGNINLNKRQVVHNSDGSISTELSITIGVDDKVVLIPTVVNGKIVSDEEAIRHYEQTGEYLGKFNTEEEAGEYAEKLHKRQEWYYSQK